MNHRFPSVSTEVRQPSLAQLDLENPEATFSHAFSRSKYRRDPKVTVTMDSGPMNAVLSGAGLLVDDGKATNEMRKSISKFATLLTCPLCNKIFDRPATLSACGHTFCMNCIDAYSSNNCECPVEGCGMPLSIVGSNGGSFRKLNLQLSQTIESLQLICTSLNQSEKNWWLSTDTLECIQEMKSSKTKDRQKKPPEPLESNDPFDFPFDGRHTRHDDCDDDEEIMDDDEEMIDLQANEEDDSSCPFTDDDDKDR